MKHILRNSSVQDFLYCRTRWDFRDDMRMGFRPLVDADELSFGTAWHRAMEVWYDPNDPKNREVTLEEFMKLIRKQDVRARESGVDFNLEEGTALGKGMLEHFFEWSAYNDDFVAIKLEQEFEVPILDPRDSMPLSFEAYRCPCGSVDGESHEFVFQGRVDAVYKRNDGSHWIGESKTAKSESDWQWHVMEPQTLRYMWALRHSMNIDIHGVIRTEALKRFPQPPGKLQRGGLSVDKRQATTTKLFLKALQEEGLELDGKYFDYVRFLQSPEAPVFVRREYVDYTTEMMQQAGESLFHIALDMVGSPRIYPNPTFMCRKCPFFVPCLVRQEQGDYLYALRTQYRKVRVGDG